MIIIRFVLTLSILLPTLAVYAHELSRHDHKGCEDKTVHFHKKEEPCFLDDFILKQTFNYSENNYRILTLKFKREPFKSKFIYQKENLLYFLRRGPPLN